MTEDSQETAEIASEVDESESLPTGTESEVETETQEPAEEVNVDSKSTETDPENTNAAEKPDAEMLKKHEAWVKMRKKNMRYRDELEQTKQKLAVYEQATPSQPQYPVNAPAQPRDTGAVLVDPTTGRQIPLYQSYDALISEQNAEQQQPYSVPQQVPQVPNAYTPPVPQQTSPQQSVAPKASTTGDNQISPYAEEQLKTTYNKMGETEVRDKLQGLVSLGGLDAAMINAAAITGQEIGENGLGMLYDLAKDRQGQQILCEIADRPDSQSRTVALSNLLYSRVAERNRRMKSTATKQAVSLPQQGNIQTKSLTPEEAFLRDQQMCLKSQGKG